jgi:hypothetical protein
MVTLKNSPRYTCFIIAAVIRSHLPQFHGVWDLAAFGVRCLYMVSFFKQNHNILTFF